MGDVSSSMWYFCTLLLSLLLPYVNFSGNDACPKAFLQTRLENQSQPFWGDFTLFEELFANPYFLLWIFCTYREALTGIWLSTLWINSVGFFGCFASESPTTHKTGQMSFGPGAPLRSALICTDARMAAPHNMLSLNVQWMIAPRGVVYLGQYSIGSGQFNLHKCL